MDELLQEFLGETGEHLETVDRELVRFERDPNDREILRNIFRLVHTVKGTCGFIGLPRLEALAHAAESVIGQFRDGATVNATAVTAILETIDRIKEIISELADKGQEPPGNDEELIRELQGLAQFAKRQRGDGEPRQPDSDAVARYLARLKSGEPAPLLADEDDDLVFRSAPLPPPPAPEAETLQSPPKDARGNGPATLRVNVETLEHLMTMVSELVLTRNQLLEIARRADDGALKAPLQRLSLITAELQDGVMKTRMQPIGNAWSKLPRIVRDLEAELGKKLDLVTEGAETEVDRQILELMKDPLIHMVRNCADHAIEMPEERRRAGKREGGTIRLSARHEGGSVTISVCDDGSGLNLARIRRKAVERGLATEAEVERLSDAQAARLIFQPGFTTAEEVTAISGRGVGMDVVKANVDAIGGVIEIATARGLGTTITIKIPLTLAIVSALIVSAGGRRLAVPQLAVRELVRVGGSADHRIERIDAAPVLRLRERLLPVVALDRLMGGAEQADKGFIVVIQVGERLFGLLVDGVLHTEEIVVKPMSAKLRHIDLFTGNTILGDGAVVLIVDPNGIARRLGAKAGGETLAGDDPAGRTGHRERTTLLLLRGAGNLRAVPLSLVTRLEEVDAARFETSGGHPVLAYRGRLMPIVPLGGSAVRTSGMQTLVVVADGDVAMALAVDEIVDIVEDELEIELLALAEPGVIGSAMLRGRATEVVDIAHYLQLANAGWPPMRGPAGAQRPRTLLVEPSEFLRDMLVPVLRALGLEVETATDAEGAIARADSASFEVVLMDCDRDPQGTFRLAATLRAAEGGTGRRLIGLSALAMPHLMAGAVEAGLDTIVGKFDRHALMAQLTECRPALRQAA